MNVRISYLLFLVICLFISFFVQPAAMVSGQEKNDADVGSSTKDLGAGKTTKNSASIDPASYKPLIPLLSDSSDVIAIRAFRILASLTTSDREIVKAIESFLDSKNATEFQQAINFISRNESDPKKLTKRLVERLESGDPKLVGIVETKLMSIAVMDNDVTVKFLCSDMRTAQAKRAVIRVMRSRRDLRPEKMIPALLYVAERTEPLRTVALETIARYGKEAAVALPKISEYLKDGDERTRLAAIGIYSATAQLDVDFVLPTDLSVAEKKIVSFATAMMKKYDVNNDSVLDGEEVRQATGIRSSVDKNQDGRITFLELVESYGLKRSR